MADPGASTVQQQLYPHPPPYFKLYMGDADGSAERPFPPPPPPPVSGEYVLFGEVHTSEAGDPPLHAAQLYNQAADGSIDFKAELHALHGELVAGICDLLGALESQPSTYARSVEALGVILRNMQHLSRLLRPFQARETLIATLQEEVAHRRACATELDKLAQEGAASGHVQLLKDALIRALGHGPALGEEAAVAGDPEQKPGGVGELQSNLEAKA
ncbi:hypothetical protein ACKKBF_B34075 [Auxenochlorella protothecoides x Auxenochlorella symbiontica]